LTKKKTHITCLFCTLQLEQNFRNICFSSI